ncbi:hypothetical protein K438DRAFT_1990364 [Mycena galopus ATCC 62051]|nr:hypothetical protein K438DRAFT_1990364 [Mycena galopus ATCC 62051]
MLPFCPLPSSRRPSPAPTARTFVGPASHAHSTLPDALAGLRRRRFAPLPAAELRRLASALLATVPVPLPLPLSPIVILDSHHRDHAVNASTSRPCTKYSVRAHKYLRSAVHLRPRSSSTPSSALPIAILAHPSVLGSSAVKFPAGILVRSDGSKAFKIRASFSLVAARARSPLEHRASAHLFVPRTTPCELSCRRLLPFTASMSLIPLSTSPCSHLTSDPPSKQGYRMTARSVAQRLGARDRAIYVQGCHASNWALFAVHIV